MRFCSEERTVAANEMDPSSASPQQQLLLLGGPGTGKTHVLKFALALQHHFFPGSVRKCAFMNSAARLIAGTTLHSALNLGLDAGTRRARRTSSQTENLLEAWRPTLLLAVDEASMLSAEFYSQAENQIQILKGVSTVPWAGLTLLLSGDFCQLPPVAATSLVSPAPPAPAPTASASVHARHVHTLRGLDLWQQVDRCVQLTYTHRTHGFLQQILAAMRAGHIPTALWQQLLTRVASTHDERLLAPHFWDSAACVGVLRHRARVAATLQRAEVLAPASGHRLLLCLAADRCRNAQNRPLIAPSFLEWLCRLPNLNQTCNLPGYLCLWPGATLCLEHKVCERYGLVRGCPVTVREILLHDLEPAFEDDPLAEPLVLQYLPRGLIVHVADASFLQSTSLKVGELLLEPIHRSWSFSPSIENIPGLDDAATTALCCQPLQVSRRQFPCTNTLACTAYNLQGRTLPAMLADLAVPPGMGREPWQLQLISL